MSTEIYIIRHGESLGNKDKIFLGQLDRDLTSLGHEQARLAAEFFKDKRVDAVYSSSLLRAVNTAKAVADLKGLEVIKSDSLREINAGDWQGRSYDNIAETYPEMWEIWRNADYENVKTPDGETPVQVLSRVYSELEEIAKKHDGQSVVVASHGLAIRIFLRHITDGKINEWAANASITKLSFKDGKFKVEFFNEHSHLGSLVTTVAKGV
ncbi:MAG: histidine phosphatase family protein [Ruminococcaceae bacterium]|nr:histidine phosphatase family protein [Oscillospiraceae bacterium]